MVHLSGLMFSKRVSDDLQSVIFTAIIYVNGVPYRFTNSLANRIAYCALEVCSLLRRPSTKISQNVGYFRNNNSPNNQPNLLSFVVVRAFGVVDQQYNAVSMRDPSHDA